MDIYDTFTKGYHKLPTEHNVVRIYVCGVTVYDRSHIGHARTIVVFDVLHRFLNSKGVSTCLVQNFTDVDDKIINRARIEGIDPIELAKKYIQLYFEDFHALNVAEANLYPRVTEHISEIVQVISGLLEKNYAYISTNGVYFRVKSFAKYGSLSKKSTEQLEAGSRVEVDSSKEDPLDFALWKFHSDYPTFTSPWGNGRPGWHIECSAMVLKYLGESIEIHGGGNDLIFPHHENEIAQSESYTGKKFARIWMHVGMVTINSEKMSKSLGNIVPIKEALQKWGPNVIRLFCLSVRYTKPLDYKDSLLKEAAQKWKQIEVCVWELEDWKGGSSNNKGRLLNSCASTSRLFNRAMENNLDTPSAIREFMKFVNEFVNSVTADDLDEEIASKAKLTIHTILNMLGLKIASVNPEDRNQIESMVKLREKLRKERKFKEADSIRLELAKEYSVELLDHKYRTTWLKSECTSF
ncbi:MAG TPA: cysteine--tRNA ligase [Nitrososphaeraceae archaeon]